jgi:hypothetical protein
VNTDDVTQVQRRILKHLNEHFEQACMDDEEFIPLTYVVIAAGASLLQEAGVPAGEVEKFTRQLNQEAKNAWLALCAKNLDAHANKAAELLLAGKDYDRILKQYARRR